MKKGSTKAKKQSGPTPAQLAAAKVAAGDGGNVLEALMSIVDEEKKQKEAEAKAKRIQVCKKQLVSIDQYMNAYFGSGKIGYNSYVLIKKEYSSITSPMHKLAMLGDEGFCEQVASCVALLKHQLPLSDYASKGGDSYLPTVLLVLENLVEAAKKLDGSNYSYAAPDFSMSKQKIENLYTQGVLAKTAKDVVSKSISSPHADNFVATMPVEKKKLIADMAPLAETQKRAGIQAIVDYGYNEKSCIDYVVQAASALCVLSPKRGDFAANKLWMEQSGVVPDLFNRLFFRPCPKTPRHGFVDSKVCTTWEEVEALYAETVAADPDCEVIVMHELEAQCSSVATSSMIAVGPGHDGATAGKESIVYEIKSADIDPKTRKAAKLAADQEGYIESVYDGKWSYLVQLRGGPKLGKNVKRLSSKPIESVREIIIAEGDALEWEAKMAALKTSPDKKHTVVWHPGGSMLSHYAIHAVIAEVALSFESTQPSLDEPFEGEVPDLNWDAAAFARGVAMAILDSKTGRLSNKEELMQSFVFAAVGIHSAAALTKGDSAQLLGGACATLMLLSAAACCGESRHNVAVRRQSGIESDRHKVFVRALSDYMQARPLLRLSLESFAGDTWGSAYGGKKWAICAAMCIDLERSLFDIVSGSGSVADAVALSHRLLNAVHNGGKLLNKFGNPSILDYAAAGSRILSIHSAHRWYSIAYGSRQLPSTKVSEMMMAVKAAGSFDLGAFEYWNSETGSFAPKSKTPATAKYILRDGIAQARIIDIDSNKVKVQYCFKVGQMDSEAYESVEEQAAPRKYYKNIMGSGDDDEEPQSESGYVSVSFYSEALVKAMTDHANNSGGLDESISMAGSGAWYVKATKVEPMGSTPKHGAKIYFGDVAVEVIP